MDHITYFKEQFDQLQSAEAGSGLQSVRSKAFDTFNQLGVPTARNEEWRYTRIAPLFNNGFQFQQTTQLVLVDVVTHRLPGHEKANELFFVNGRYHADLSKIISPSLQVSGLEEALQDERKDFVLTHFGHSGVYLRDGINALNTALVRDAVLISVPKSAEVEHPVYIYNITDSRTENTLSLPRSLFHVGVNAQIQIAETFITIGTQDSFTNQIMELVVEEDARLEYYIIQNDVNQANIVSTTHVRHIGKSYSHGVTISLNGGMVRNNLNIVLEKPYCEAHLYGLYFQQGNSHIDNHTVVDNVSPNCFSNELYKGMLDDNSTGVFNGKIFVRQPAQKTNAFQSNKNVLLSGDASVNTKPQLEIFADDVKCSHGCTIGRLDEEGLFYLQSRGVPEKVAKAMLLQGFASDIIDKINIPAIRSYVETLIAQRLEYTAD